MPRAPQSPAISIPSAVVGVPPQQVQAAAERNLRPLLTVVDQSERTAQSRLLTEATTQLTRSLNDYEAQVPDLPPEQILSGFQDLVEQTKQSIREDTLREDGRLVEAFEIRTLDLLESRRARLAFRQRDELEDAEIAALEERGVEARRAMDLAPDSRQAEEEWRAFEQAIEGSSLSEEKKGEFRRSANRSVDMDAAMRLVLEDPDAFLDTSGTPEEFFDHYPGLLPSDRITLRQSAENRKIRLDNERDDSIDQQQDETFLRYYQALVRGDTLIDGMAPREAVANVIPFVGPVHAKALTSRLDAGPAKINDVGTLQRINEQMYDLGIGFQEMQMELDESLSSGLLTDSRYLDYSQQNREFRRGEAESPVNRIRKGLDRQIRQLVPSLDASIFPALGAAEEEERVLASQSFNAFLSENPNATISEMNEKAREIRLESARRLETIREASMQASGSEAIQMLLNASEPQKARDNAVQEMRALPDRVSNGELTQEEATRKAIELGNMIRSLDLQQGED